MADCVPGPDADFDRWQEKWVSYAAANAEALGLDPLIDIPAMQAARAEWHRDYDAHLNAEAVAAAVRQAKEGQRTTYAALLRSFSQQIQKRSGTTDEQRGGLGLVIA